MRRYLAESLGTALIVLAVVGSAHMATFLTKDSGVWLLINCLSTVSALYISILLFRTISGAHFNPIVSIIAGLQRALSGKEVGLYLLAQFTGAIFGVMVANSMFDSPILSISTINRANSGTLVGELISSAGLITLIFAHWLEISNDRRATLISLWIASAYFFTSSTSFANPAVSFGRIFTESYAGIDVRSFALFLLAQSMGGAIAFLMMKRVGKP